MNPKELGKYSNYKEQINNLSKRWEIQSLAEEITKYIWDEIIKKRPLWNTNSNSTPKSGFDYEWDKLQSELLERQRQKALEEEIERLKNASPENLQQQEKKQEKITEKEQELAKIKKNNKYDKQNQEEENWAQEKEKFMKRIQQSETEKKQLEEKVKKLEDENKKLREEIQELKKENDNTPEYQSYLNKKENQLKNNEIMLREIKSIIDKAQQNPNNNSNFPTGWVVGGGLILLTLLLVIILVKLVKKDRLKKKY